MSLKEKAIDVPTFLVNIREIYTSDFRWQSSEKYVKLSDAGEEIEKQLDLLSEKYKHRLQRKEKEIQTLVELLRRAEKEINPFYLQGLETKKEIKQALMNYE